MQQGKQINFIEDIQRDRVLHASVVEKCDLIINLFLKNDILQKQLNEFKKDDGGKKEK